MSDDLFIKKMKGVRPISKEKTIHKNEEKINKPKTIKVASQDIRVIEKSNIENRNTTQLNLSFGELNKELKRGKINIDRRLDLHGYTLIDAYEKFKNEVTKMYKAKKRCILVVTGKGLNSKNNNINERPRLFHGKIKNSIISWINEEELRKHILTYQDASFEHGGDGAIFVYLRKNKN